MSHKKNKKKKEKIIWYDDNSTIADMSAVSGIGGKPKSNQPANKPRSTFKDKWHTYWTTVKQMLLPMTVVLAIIALLYVIIMLITGGFSR